MAKQSRSYRLAADALSAIERLAEIQGGSHTAAIEHLAREWERTHRLEALEGQLADHEQRIRALESPRAPPGEQR